jgi:hypothetical protein
MNSARPGRARHQLVAPLSASCLQKVCTLWNKALDGMLLTLPSGLRARGTSMQIEDRRGDEATQGAVLRLLHSDDNRQTLRNLLNLAVDMKLPATFVALLGELERVDDA